MKVRLMKVVQSSTYMPIGPHLKVAQTLNLQFRKLVKKRNVREIKTICHPRCCCLHQLKVCTLCTLGFCEMWLALAWLTCWSQELACASVI